MAAGLTGRMKWLKGFDVRIFSHTLRLAKPEPEIYRHAAERLGIDPARILFVDDRADNCEGGRAAGMHVVQYEDHAEFLREMERRGWGELWRNGRDVGS